MLQSCKEYRIQYVILQCIVLDTILAFTQFYLYCPFLIGSPDDWEAFLHYLGCLLEEDMHWPSPKATDQIYSPNFVDFQAKGVQLTEEVVLILVTNMCSLFYIPIKHLLEACFYQMGFHLPK